MEKLFLLSKYWVPLLIGMTSALYEKELLGPMFCFGMACYLLGLYAGFFSAVRVRIQTP
jgi:hypothetical protein